MTMTQLLLLGATAAVVFCCLNIVLREDEPARQNWAKPTWLTLATWCVLYAISVLAPAPPATETADTGTRDAETETVPGPASTETEQASSETSVIGCVFEIPEYMQIEPPLEPGDRPTEAQEHDQSDSPGTPE